MRIPAAVDRLRRRLMPLVPDGALSAARAVASFGGGGPLVGAPYVRRALVLAPHPDDETIGAGGTLSLLARAGAAVTVVVLTNGEMTPGTGLSPPEVGRRRVVETGEACRRLGLTEPRFLAFPDGGLGGAVADLGRRLRAVIDETDPDAVFLPWFGDGHADHRAVTAAFAEARPAPSLVVWSYEVWSPLPANRLVDITSVIARKQQALEAHATAYRSFDLDAMLGLSRYRSVHGLAGQGFAEAFLVAGAPTYLSLAEAVHRPDRAVET